MRTGYLFHDVGCCLTDCLVRHCTCGVDPVSGPDAPNRSSALSEGEALIGSRRDGGIRIEALSHKVDEKDGVLLFHFLTSCEAEADNLD